MDERVISSPGEFLEEVIEHHGIKGQKWGVRNAEWYPIEAYNRAKGIVKDAVSSDTAKKAASVTKDVAKATTKAAKGAVEVTKKTGAKAAEKYSEHRTKSKEKKARRKQVVQEHKKEVAEAEKKRILTSGTPRDVLRIADQLTNEELQYAKNRNDLLKQLRELDSKQVSDMKKKQVQKKWGKLMDLGQTVKMVSEPIDDAATALQRINKLRKAIGGSDGNKNNDQNQDDQNKEDQNKEEKKKKKKKQGGD